MAPTEKIVLTHESFVAAVRELAAEFGASWATANVTQFIYADAERGAEFTAYRASARFGRGSKEVVVAEDGNDDGEKVLANMRRKLEAHVSSLPAHPFARHAEMLRRAEVSP